jgi:hypothetical protein
MKHSCTCNDNIKMCQKEQDEEDMNWFHFSQGSMQWRALVNKLMNFPVP